MTLDFEIWSSPNSKIQDGVLKGPPCWPPSLSTIPSSRLEKWTNQTSVFGLEWGSTNQNPVWDSNPTAVAGCGEGKIFFPGFPSYLLPKFQHLKGIKICSAIGLSISRQTQRVTGP